MSHFVSRGNTVWVKPNIGWTGDRSSRHDDPDVVATVVEITCGSAKRSWSATILRRTRNTFPRSGIQQAAAKAPGAVFLLDEQKFRKIAIDGKVLKEWLIYQDVVEADRLINVAMSKSRMT